MTIPLEVKEEKPIIKEFPLAPDTLVQDRYRIVRQLGKGGMGVVYQAVDLRLGTTVALKQVISTNVQLRRQFEREARMLAELRHSALPRVTDYFAEEDRAFLVMEFMAGVDLAQIIMQQAGPFPRHEVIAWADQLLDALVYLHSSDRQVIHRDIKPHNLKLKPNGQIALLDFGLAKASSGDSVNSATSVFGYTPRYAPLEQIQDLGTTPESDIYALGATLYHLLTGLKPPDALTRAAALVKSEPSPLRPANEIVDAVGPELAAILMKAMAQDPADRYHSAIEFREALRRLGRNRDEALTGYNSLETGSVLGLTETDSASFVAPVMATSQPRSRALAIAAGILAVLGVGGAIGFASYPWTWPQVADSDAAVDATSSPADKQSAANQNRAKHHDKALSSAVADKIEPGETQRGFVKTDLPTESPAETLKAAPQPVVVPDKPRQQSKATATPSPKLAQPSRPVIPLPDVNTEMPAASAGAAGAAAAATGVDEDLVAEKATHDASIVKAVMLGPQGSRIVKFADGTTRVFRPGDKIKRSTD